MLHIHLHLLIALTRRTNGRNLGTFQKQFSSGNRGAWDRNVPLLIRLLQCSDVSKMITSEPESHQPDKPTTAISSQLWELRSLTL